MTTDRRKTLIHPLIVALFSGIILAILGNYFTHIRESKENLLFEKASEIQEYEKYVDELALSSTLLYSAVENYILDLKEFKDSNLKEKYEERIWGDIQKINLARAPLFASLEKLKTSEMGINNKQKFEDYYIFILKITTLCQTRRKDKVEEIRILLDTKYTPTQNLLLFNIQQKINSLRGM